MVVIRIQEIRITIAQFSDRWADVARGAEITGISELTGQINVGFHNLNGLTSPVYILKHLNFSSYCFQGVKK
jgi:hypothetical protein